MSKNIKVQLMCYVWSRQCFSDAADSALRAPRSLRQLVRNLVAYSQRLRKVPASGGTRREFILASGHTGSPSHLKVEKAPDTLAEGRIA